ncbi:molecular chaperone HtpG [Wohlfahrtiimonas chitiniclastica]|uniref:molecular chaperone HtpG n=1 Tax=Wohlfahrtiimonas chitiniclastica TaxID=400946 RepID=UPI001BCD5692|nr:molecular chaperone HtpG [Wohlfahrtiimonas chitiniclastica]MBS7825663.1 molecular chaperone HtpG [Wohlfahrtiimonas chitiniclastica]
MSQKETLQFQTEVNQLLKLMIHSLYSNHEIFLRELISNASDALDKRRFEGLTNAALIENQGNPEILIQMDKAAKTLTISDNGIGMTRDEVIENIGTIAKSGTKAFLEQLTDEDKDASQLIGQFGVGFYSAFIVADHVTLTTRKAGEPENSAVIWSSAGEGEFSLEATTKARAGTEIVLHMRDEHSNLLNEWSLKQIITKYSDHIAYPVMMEVEKVETVPAEKEGEEPTTTTTVAIEQVNSATSIWQRDKKDVPDADYEAFYQHISHDYDKPLTWSRNKVEGKVSYTSLLYIPSHSAQNMWEQNSEYGLQLYVRRVFIMNANEKLLPRYLRFVKGVVDTADLPLNVSREILQSSSTLDAIKQGVTRRVLSMIEALANTEQEKFTQFYQAFSRILKEGIGEDHGNKEKIAGLLRFASTQTDEEQVSFADYISRMKEGQENIYFITTDNLNTAKNSPHLEIYREKGYEVILMTDVIDDWMMGYLSEFEGKKFVNIAKGDVHLDNDEKKEDEEPQLDHEEKAIIDKLTHVLGNHVEKVKVSKRLTNSASVLVRNEYALSSHFEKMLKEAGHDVPNMKPWLEVNVKHPLVERIARETDNSVADDLAMLIYEEALLLEGSQLENPSEFVNRLNRLMK